MSFSAVRIVAQTIEESRRYLRHLCGKIVPFPIMFVGGGRSTSERKILSLRAAHMIHPEIVYENRIKLKTVWQYFLLAMLRDSCSHLRLQNGFNSFLFSCKFKLRLARLDRLFAS